MNQLLMTAQETSKALAISPRKLWQMTASSEIPFIRIGRSVRYPVNELELWIETKKNGGNQ